MRRIPRADTALRLAQTQATTTTTTNPASYICLTCRTSLQTPTATPARARPFHTTRLLAAEEKLPWHKRIQQTLFGRDEKVDHQQIREDKRRARAEAQAAAEEEEAAEARVVVDRRTGREYRVADVVDAGVDRGYVAASDWKELERVGGEEWVRRRADGGEAFVGFSAPVKAKAQLKDQEWIRLLHHVTVEVLALYKNGRDVSQVCNLRVADSQSWKQTSNTSIDIRPDGAGVALGFPNPQDEQSILDAISPEASGEEILRDPAALERINNAQIAEIKGVLSPALAPAPAGKKSRIRRAEHASPTTERATVEEWLALSLTTAPEIKLAILKRVTQITGIRPSDPAVSSAHSLGDLLHVFRAKPKPNKLAQRKEMVGIRDESANVQVYHYRRSPIHREKEVGRWKVIEQALIERDLPVTGSRWASAKLTQ